MRVDLELLGIKLPADEILRHLFNQQTETKLEDSEVILIRQLRPGTIKAITVSHQQYIQDTIVTDVTKLKETKIQPSDIEFMRDIAFYAYLDYRELAEVANVKNQKVIDNRLSRIKRDYKISRPMFSTVLYYLDTTGKFIIEDLILT